MSERTCAYCGLEKCRCAYRVGRAGGCAVEAYSTMAQTNLAEMVEALKPFLESMDPKTPTVWKFSFTRLDPEKIGKYKESK